MIIGIDDLAKILQVNKKRLRNETKVKLYKAVTLGLPAIFAMIILAYILNATQNTILAVLLGMFSYIPLIEIVIKIVNTILSKTTKPKLIPKLDFLEGVPKEYSTFVVIPTIVDNKKKVRSLDFLLNESSNK